LWRHIKGKEKRKVAKHTVIRKGGKEHGEAGRGKEEKGGLLGEKETAGQERENPGDPGKEER